MLEALSHVSLVEDAIIVVVGAVISLLLKTVIKPSKIEAKLLAQFLSFVVIGIIRHLAKHHKEVNPHVKPLSDCVEDLKRSITKKGKIELG